MSNPKYIYSILALVLAALMVACAPATEQDQQRTAGEYVDDTAISARVNTALANDPDVGALEIGVETYDGTVQLSGFVDDEVQMRRAEEIAMGVEGVREVENDLQLAHDRLR